MKARPEMPTLTAPAVQQNLAAAREAFRSRRLASHQAQLHNFYVEHNLFDEARWSRALMLDHLREACRQWRSALGISL